MEEKITFAMLEYEYKMFVHSIPELRIILGLPDFGREGSAPGVDAFQQSFEE
jgi:hypothetical protein